ncbi:MAG: N-acetyl-D-myo-inositol-2-amino-2-deoxy-alpha-D-glucopyranoside deacetylase [Frankiaceae bacterium]|nr:N-acetyl-D-myo-inositol-2-amino-2-deoxy-alpha-D-glucopyranoside deacetylase [Frankiaceae bacterium]
MTTSPESPSPGERISTSDAEDILRDVETQVDAFETELDMDPLDNARRLLLVHAHPDDETIGTGASMAKYAHEGALVTLVTCTLGEQGEVLVPDLEHLAADKDDALGVQRIDELAVAMEALGVKDHRFLGGPGRWRDSDMMGRVGNNDPRCFWQCDFDEAVGEMVKVMREVRPQVVVTYDENGGYGHPDHIQAHRVAVAGFHAAGDPDQFPEAGEPWQPSKLYYTAMARSSMQKVIDWFRSNPDAPSFMGPEVTDASDIPFTVPDEDITTEVDATDYFDHKMAAMRAHKTQIAVDGPFFAMADGFGHRAWGLETFVLAYGEKGETAAESGRETDLFAGVE